MLVERCVDCGREAPPEARLCVPCYDSRISRGIRLDPNLKVLDSNALELAREQQRLAQRRYERKHRQGVRAVGPQRRIVGRHYLTARELEELGHPELRFQVLMRLECGHRVLRARNGRQERARCGHCDQEEVAND